MTGEQFFSYIHHIHNSEKLQSAFLITECRAEQLQALCRMAVTTTCVYDFLQCGRQAWSRWTNCQCQHYV